MAHKKKAEADLKGTLLMTFGVGLIIIIVWGACFGIFMDRF
ncbi:MULTISPECIES: hypothetical protein [unclassified Lysinibacillus]